MSRGGYLYLPNFVKTNENNKIVLDEDVHRYRTNFKNKLIKIHI